MTEETTLHPSIIARIEMYNRWIQEAKEANPYVAQLNTIAKDIVAKHDEAIFDGSHTLLRVYPKDYNEAVATLRVLASAFGKYSVIKYEDAGSIDYNFAHAIRASFYFLESASCRFVKVGEKETVRKTPIYAFQCNGDDTDTPNGGIE